MEEQKAHELFQHFSDVHAAAKSGRVSGDHRIIHLTYLAGISGKANVKSKV